RGDVSALRIRVFTLAGMAVQLRRNTQNVKNSLRGSCHTLGAKHLPRHLAEYCFRFNHRFDLKSMLVELGHAVVASPPMPYRLLKLAEGHG
ncbi:hypothetical protein ACV1EF_20060, partial [Aeromonas hydrophila]